MSLIRRETGLFHPTILGPDGRATLVRKELVAGASSVSLG